MAWLTNNFQPLWVQYAVVGLIVVAITSFVILAWLTFWEWRDKQMTKIITLVIKELKPDWIPLHLRRKRK